MAADRTELVEPGRPHVDSTQLRVRLVGLVQRRVERRTGEGLEHRQHDPLRAAPLGEVVVHHRHALAHRGLHRCSRMTLCRTDRGDETESS